MMRPDSAALDRFARTRRDTPERPLIHQPTDRRTLTARELDELADVFRRVLDALPPHAVVMSAMENRPEFVALALACLSTGHPLMAADPGTRAEVALRISAAWRAAATISVPYDGVPEPDGLLPGGLAWWRGAADPQAYGDVAVMKLTSGSTGAPKAVLATSANLAYDVSHIVESMDIRPDDVQLAAIPLSHAYGFDNLLMPVFWQGTAIVIRDGFVPHRLVDDVRQYGIRVWPGVPFMFDHLLQHLPAGSFPRPLERLMSAGAPLEHTLSVQFRDRFGIKIHSFYGTSETGGITFDDTDEVGPYATVGRLMPDVTITFRQVEGADGDTRRVHVAGPAVARGYAVLEAHQAEGFDAEGFLTGDLGYFDDRGHLVLTGRVSSFVNVAGRKVQPEEVARCLREMPELADVRVVGAVCPIRGEQLVAVVVPRHEAPSVVALRTFCASRLPAYKVPREFLVTGAIPVDARGKTNRTALGALVDAHLQAGVRRSPDAILHPASPSMTSREEPR